ncbi:MAG: hypothetical protein KJ717_00010, partial [Proteobacteria bacterium]|nr:hypothetical protein [Pseudomonadota bacterium]
LTRHDLPLWPVVIIALSGKWSRCFKKIVVKVWICRDRGAEDGGQEINDQMRRLNACKKNL